MIVQALIGNKGWRSMSQSGRSCHVGTTKSQRKHLCCRSEGHDWIFTPRFLSSCYLCSSSRPPIGRKAWCRHKFLGYAWHKPVIQGDLLIPEAYLVQWSLANGTTFLVQRRIPLNAIHGRFQFLSFIF